MNAGSGGNNETGSNLYSPYYKLTIKDCPENSTNTEFKVFVESTNPKDTFNHLLYIQLTLKVQLLNK